MILKHLFGKDLPKAGTVRGKAKDDPRSVDYGGNIGRVTINDQPVYWLAIEVKGARGKNKIRNVPRLQKRMGSRPRRRAMDRHGVTESREGHVPPCPTF